MKTSPAYDNVRHDRERDQDLAPDTYRQYERTEKSGAGQYGGYHKVQFKKNATPGDTSDFLKRPTFKARRPTY